MYAQQSTNYSGLSLKESDPKFAGAATHIHNKDSSGCCLNSTTSVRSHSLQPQSSALHKGPDDWVLEVELCLPVPQIVHLHPAQDPACSHNVSSSPERHLLISWPHMYLLVLHCHSRKGKHRRSVLSSGHVQRRRAASAGGTANLVAS